MTFPLARAFFTGRGEPTEPSPAFERALEEACRTALGADGRTADAATSARFARYLGKVTGKGPPEQSLSSIQLQDASIAWGCLEGDASAIEKLAELVLRSDVGKARVADDIVEEARQLLLERLLLGETPKIAQYDGRGPLSAWIRVALARDCIHLHKKTLREMPLSEELLALPERSDDAELALFKETFRHSYKEAFEAAVVSLDARERSLLRQHLVLTMSIDMVANIHGVHRATAARWIADAKEHLGRELKKELRSRCRLDGTELDRAVLLVESRLDISVHRLFRTEQKETRSE